MELLRYYSLHQISYILLGLIAPHSKQYKEEEKIFKKKEYLSEVKETLKKTKNPELTTQLIDNFKKILNSEDYLTIEKILK